MRIGNSFLLAISAYATQFLATESYVLKSARPIVTAGSSSNSCRRIVSNDFIRPQLESPLTLSNMQLHSSNGGDHHGDDHHVVNSISSFVQQLLKKAKGPFGGLIAAFMIFFVSIRGATARPQKSANSNSLSQKSTVKQKRNGRGTLQTRKVVKKAEVEIVVEKKVDTNSKLSKIGFVLVGVSTVATLLSGDDDKKKSKKSTASKQFNKVPVRPTSPTVFDSEEEEDQEIERPVVRSSDKLQGIKGSMNMSKKVRKGLGVINSLPPPEELFSSEDADDFFKEDTPPTKKKFSLPPSKVKKEQAAEKIFQDDYASTVDEEDFTVIPTPIPANIIPPPAAPAKKSIFDRIFKKGGTSRPTDLGEVISMDDTASSFRAATATTLTVYLPQGLDLFADVQLGGVLAYSAVDDSMFDSEEKRVSLLSSVMKDLTSKEAADAFADVTNAMLVSLTDRCVDLLDKRGKTSEEVELATVSALDLLTEFAISAASLFGRVLPGVIIEDGGIKYNGKAQKGKLETLFSNYLKTGMDMGPMKNLISDQTDDEDAESTDAVADAEKRQGRMSCLQHVFSISEGKRSSLEQKAMKDMIMGMMGGDGAAMGDLAGMLGNMGGMGGPGAKGGPQMDEAAFDEMMKKAQKDAGGGDKDMDPAEMAKMLNESLVQMKQQLKEGSVTKDDVIELERSMGMGMKEMVGMVEMAKKMAGKQNIPEIDEMLALFKQLLTLKR